MRDYTATITLRVPIQARNDEQANERAEMIEEQAARIKAAKWLGDVETEIEIEEN